MEFDEVENLSEEQILELYSDVVEKKIIISPTYVYQHNPGGGFYSSGSDGWSYVDPNGCIYRVEVRGYTQIPTYYCPVK